MSAEPIAGTMESGQAGKPDLRRPRSIRLTRSHEFAAVRKDGRRAHGRFLVLAVAPIAESPSAESKLGVIASRRVGGAVVRNRLRRRCKELHRLSRPLLPPGLGIVLTIKKEASGASFEELQTEWLRLARKLSILPRS